MPSLAMLRALWAYRGFVISSVSREFHAKYRESLLGAFWAVAQPLSMIIVYTVIFGQLMRPTLARHEQTPFSFSIYLCAGLLTWNLFSEMLSRMNMVFLDNGNLIKKAKFPHICLPAIVAVSALMNFAIVLALFLGFLALIGRLPGWTLLALFPLLVLQVLFALGVGLLMGTVNVFFRDVAPLTQIGLQFWFWLTPVVYTASALPEAVGRLLALNPLVPLVQAYQGIFLEYAWPRWSSLWPLAVLTLGLLLLSGCFFMARVGEMVDEL